MPIKQTAKAIHARAASARAGIGKAANRLTAPIRYRLTRRIHRNRRFWLLVAAKTWPFPIGLWFVITGPLCAPNNPWLSWTLKVLTAVLLTMYWFDTYFATRRRWSRLKR